MEATVKTFGAIIDLDVEAWVRDHSPILIWLGLILFALLIVRLIVRQVTRMLALAIIGLLGLVVFAERGAIRECTRTCECAIGVSHVEIPWCRPGLDL